MGMKAVRFYGKEDIRYEEVPEPEVGKGLVKVRPSWCGICGTDLHEYLGGPNISPTSPHPLTGDKVPVIVGHEFSGIVEEVGEGVEKFKKGDRVVVQPIIYDGTCGACVEGYINCCYKQGFLGLSGIGGGLADSIVLKESYLFHLPDNVSLEVGALVEPLAVAWHAVNMGDFQSGESVLILGGGPIGLAVILALKARGADKIIVSEVAERRKQFARDLGAHHVLDPTKDDVVARCKELCDGQGVHKVFDAAGVQAGLDTGIDALRARGTLVNIAVWEKSAQIIPNNILFKEKRYQGIATYVDGDFQAVIDAIASGKLKPESLITKRVTREDIESEGYHALIHDKANQVKILVEVGGGK